MTVNFDYESEGQNEFNNEKNGQKVDEYNNCEHPKRDLTTSKWIYNRIFFFVTKK